MSCCGKSTRKRIQKITEESNLVKNNLKYLKSFKDSKPKALKNQTLLDYHKKTHMLYAGNLKRRPLNKPFINDIVELHDRFVTEMLKRGMKHNTPLKKV